MEQFLWDFSVYISLLGFVLLIVSVLTGLRIIKIKQKFKIHKKTAIAAFITIMIHSGIMIYFYFFT
jgi:hypothetical protein